MSFEQRSVDRVHAQAKAAKRRYAHKSRSWGDVVDHPSEVSVVWSVFETEEHFERYSGMDVFSDAFQGQEPVSTDRVCIDEKMAKDFPVLNEFLTATPMLNGKRRKVATLNIVYEDGRCKAGLRERDRELSLWVSAEGLGEALRALEEALNERPVQWRKVNGDYKSRGRQ